MEILSLAVSEMRQCCQNRSWSAAAILYFKCNDSCYIYNIMPFNYTGLMTCRWNQKNEDSISNGFRDITMFSKSNMAAVAVLDFRQNCSYYII